eukprot:COSAG05_NODE_5056_length_1277_cov_1.852292_2_plen_43_part_00
MHIRYLRIQLIGYSCVISTLGVAVNTARDEYWQLIIAHAIYG